MATTFYLVCGSTSSGNRLMASVLVRSGCRGEGSTNQPPEFEVPVCDGRDLVVIAHTRIPKWIQAATAAGYDRVVAIVMVREEYATTMSQKAVGHPTIEGRGHQYTRAIQTARNMAAGLMWADATHVQTFEGLTEAALRVWLPVIGLEYVEGDLELAGQPEAPTTPDGLAANSKHYG